MESHTGVNCFQIVVAMRSSPALKLAKPRYSNSVAFSNSIDYGVKHSLDHLLDLLWAHFRYPPTLRYLCLLLDKFYKFCSVDRLRGHCSSSATAWSDAWPGQ